MKQPSGFAHILSLSDHGDGRFTGNPGPGVGSRLFGGHSLAQALMAACLNEGTDKLPHSLHAHFLSLGAADKPSSYQVNDIAHGSSFARRRVDAYQGDAHLLTMMVSFQIPEDGFSHAIDAPDMLDVAKAREALEDWKTQQDNFGALPILGKLWERPVEAIPLDVESLFGDTPRAPNSGCWMRARDSGPVDPATARAQLAYASDMLFLRNALLPHAIRPGDRKMQVASLDHTIWFHSTPDLARWHLYATQSPWAGAGRGLNHGYFFAEDGSLVATVTQENLMRRRA